MVGAAICSCRDEYDHFQTTLRLLKLAGMNMLYWVTSLCTFTSFTLPRIQCILFVLKTCDCCLVALCAGSWTFFHSQAKIWTKYTLFFLSFETTHKRVKEWKSLKYRFFDKIFSFYNLSYIAKMSLYCYGLF